MIVGITGTGVPFDRMVGALAMHARATGEAVWVQHGAAELPVGIEGVALLPRDELLERLRACDVVVCHGGCGTIFDALSTGHTPVVVPRRAHLGEHVNDHQLELVDVLSAQGRIIPLHDVRQLSDAVATARGSRGGPKCKSADTSNLILALRDDAEALCNAFPGTPSKWRLMRALTWWVPIRGTSTA